MDFVLFFILSITVFMGTISGYFLALIAPEELKGGKRYLKIMYSLVFALTLAIAASVYSLVLALIIFPILFILVFKLKRIGITYYLMPLLLFVVMDYEVFHFEASLMFLLGMPLASLESLGFVKENKIRKPFSLLGRIIRRYIWFIPISLLPFLFS